MTNFPTTSEALVKPKKGLNNGSKKSLGLITTLANAGIWIVALALLQITKPSYVSKGAMIIPGVGTQGNVSAPDFSVSSSSNREGQSPYSYLLKIDPRKNYQYIAMSDTVLSQASKAMNMSLEEFGEPTIILGEGTTIMEFALEGTSAYEAQRKAEVFYEALVSHTDYLRTTQLNSQKETTTKTLESSNTNVREAHQRLDEFRKKSSLKATEQIEKLSETLEELRLDKANLSTQKESVYSRLRSLEANLNLSTSQAYESLLIADDLVLQESLETYSTALNNIQDLQSSFTANSPQVINEQEKIDTIKQLILNRGVQLLNRPMTIQAIEELNLSGSRRDLAELLVTLQTEYTGLENEIDELQRQITSLDTRLTLLVREQPTLNRLEQDVRLSESILVSDVAKLKVDKPELATSYPALQLLLEPSLPEEPQGNTKKMIILGALAASFLLTTGMIMFWWEPRIRAKSQEG